VHHQFGGSKDDRLNWNRDQRVANWRYSAVELRHYCSQLFDSLRVSSAQSPCWKVYCHYRVSLYWSHVTQPIVIFFFDIHWVRSSFDRIFKKCKNKTNILKIWKSIIHVKLVTDTEHRKHVGNKTTKNAFWLNSHKPYLGLFFASITYN